MDSRCLQGGAKYVVRSRVPIVDCIWTDVRSMSTQRYSLSPTPIPIVPWDTCIERLKMGLRTRSNDGADDVSADGTPRLSITWDKPAEPTGLRVGLDVSESDGTRPT